MTKLDTAKRLAKAHFRVEPDLKYVFVLEPLHEHDAKDPIKLLEVVEGTIELGFEPIGFPPDPKHGVDYPSWVIEVSPAEYDAVKAQGKVHLGNEHWEIGEELKPD